MRVCDVGVSVSVCETGRLVALARHIAAPLPLCSHT